MMKSLWSGVSGLQAHQIAMDVEGNNIANVNTTGFKYERVSFADMLSQTYRLSSPPSGDLGGTNATQVGLGASVNATSRMFMQGSIQTTDKATDLAIEGDGFFVVSGDGGDTYQFTRNGDFSFDTKGNFVDNAGNIVQGWTREITNNGNLCNSSSDLLRVDTTKPVSPIVIEPGLKIPANKTSEVLVKANLNSGLSVSKFDCVYPTDNTGIMKDRDGNTVQNGGAINLVAYPDFSALVNKEGDAFSLANGQGTRVKIGNTTVDFRYTDGTPPVNTAGTGAGTALPADYTGDVPASTNTYYFKTLEDLRKSLATASGGQATIDSNGKLTVTNNTATDINMTVYPITTTIDANTSENVMFSDMMAGLSGTVVAGKSRSTETINVPINTASVDIYDSFGTKHTLEIEYRKAESKTVGSEWSFTMKLPEPAQFDDITPASNRFYGGKVVFGSDGSLLSFSPTSIKWTPNNGAEGNQAVTLNFGKGSFDGLTGLDRPSSVSLISQDGYSGGELLKIDADASGKLIGNFSNGRSIALGQVSVAKFANNMGLQSNGGNLFSKTSNSGEPTIGTAGTAGRGTLFASSLEMSNVDLSKSLTQLIVVQRGYQANSKTITTSDQMLNTLLQIKQ